VTSRNDNGGIRGQIVDILHVTCLLASTGDQTVFALTSNASATPVSMVNLPVNSLREFYIRYTR